MQLDVGSSVGSKYESTAKLREAIVTISKYVQDREAQERWADNLRFLTPIENLAMSASWSTSDQSPEEQLGALSIEDEDDDTACSCDSYGYKFAPVDPSLLLTQQSDVPECVHYVAVSYCLRSSEQSTYRWLGESELATPSIMEAGRVSRAPRCPPALLARCTAFAASHDYKFIWIDQECIVQNNVQDKTLGIQAMDLVYDQAEQCVAVLEACFHKQRHLNALENLVENDSDQLWRDTGTRDACEALRVILSDPWFERTWCLQESTAGGTRMTLLIRYDPELQVPEHFTSDVYGCLEIELSWLHTAIGCLNWVNGPDDQRLRRGTAEEALEVIGRWYDCMPQEPDAKAGGGTFGGRTVCDAADALYYMNMRHNSVISDRLAILANMCGYTVKLDALALESQGFDFSICVAVLAALNGDFSIQHGYADFAATGVGGRKFVGWNQPLERAAPLRTDDLPFTWWPPLVASLTQVPLYDWAYKDPPGRNVRQAVLAGESLDNGLKVDGYLFVADLAVDVSDLVVALLDRWHEVLLELFPRRGIFATADIARVDPAFDEARHAFFTQVFCRLVKQGYTGLARLLWEYGRGIATTRERRDPDTARWYQADAADVVDITGGKVKWRKPRLLPRTDELPHASPFQASWLMSMVLFQALTQGTLVIARPVRSPRQSSSYMALFDDQRRDVTYLAARINGQLKSLHSHLGWYPSEWVVHSETSHRDEQPSPTVAKCLANVCSLWKAKAEYMEPVLLQ